MIALALQNSPHNWHSGACGVYFFHISIFTIHMTCSKCNTTMIEGVLILVGGGIRFASSEETKGLFGALFRKPLNATIRTYKCSACGYLENYDVTPASKA